MTKPELVEESKTIPPITLSAVETALFVLALKEREGTKDAADRVFAERLTPIRDAHGIAKGTKVNFADGPDGTVVLEIRE